MLQAVGDDQVQQLVPVIEPAGGIDDQQAIRIAIQGDAEIRTATGNSRGQELGMCGSGPWLMFMPSGAQPMATTSAPSSCKTMGAI
jgi:hypothetical protein